MFGTIQVVSSPADEHPYDALALLRNDVVMLAAEQLEALDDRALGDHLVAVDRVIAQLEAQRCRALAVFDARRAYATANHRSTVAFLRRECRMSAPAAAARVEVARRLPELPTAQQAFVEGSIGYQHAAV